MAASLILFDVDGTLVDAGGAGRRAMGRAFGRVFDVDAFENRVARVPFAGKTDPAILEGLAEALGVPAPALEESRHALEEAYYEALQEEMARSDPRRRVLPGVRALLDELQGREDAVLGLVTGNFERGARLKLEPFGLNGYFADGGFASDHRERDAIARLAREKLSRRSGVDFPPSRVAVVGDTDSDVHCARNNGYRAVAVNTGFVPRERLVSSRPDVLLDGLEDLPAVLRALALG